MSKVSKDLWLTGSIMVCLSLLPWSVKAQFTGVTNDQLQNLAPLASTPGPKLFSFFDPQKFSMHHAYSLSFASDGKRTFSNGLYLNTMQYQFSAPLLFRLKWGLQTLPGMNSAQPLFSKNKLVIPSVELLYRPLQNMILKVEYRSNPDPLPYPLNNQSNLFFE